jgi:hypothetical protein
MGYRPTPEEVDFTTVRRELDATLERLDDLDVDARAGVARALARIIEAADGVG